MTKPETKVAALLAQRKELRDACEAALTEAIGWRIVNEVLDPRVKLMPEYAIITKLRAALANTK